MAINIREDISEFGRTQPVVLGRKTVLKTCLAVIKAMQNELPEEAHSMEVFDYVLRESSDVLHGQPVKLLVCETAYACVKGGGLV